VDGDREGQRQPHSAHSDLFQQADRKFGGGGHLINAGCRVAARFAAMSRGRLPPAGAAHSAGDAVAPHLRLTSFRRSPSARQEQGIAIVGTLQSKPASR
jgi:hypothetical protein